MHIRLQKNDLKLFKFLIDDFLLLTRDQIQTLFPKRGKRTTNLRLTKLTQAGYIRRKDPKSKWSPQVYFYFIGSKAPGALDRNRQDILKRIKKATAVRDGSLQHRYWLNTVRIGFLTSLIQYKDYTLNTWVRSDSKVWNTVLDFHLRPDAYVHYQKGKHQYSCFIELDLETENTQMIRQKLRLYNDSNHLERLWSAFPIPWIRVLFIVPTTSRADALRKLFPSDMFWVTTIDDFTSHKLFDLYWRSKSQESLTLELLPTSANLPKPNLPPLPYPPLPPIQIPDVTDEQLRNYHKRPESDEDKLRQDLRPDDTLNPIFALIIWALAAIAGPILSLIIYEIYILLVLATDYLDLFFLPLTNPNARGF